MSPGRVPRKLRPGEYDFVRLPAMRYKFYIEIFMTRP